MKQQQPEAMWRAGTLPVTLISELPLLQHEAEEERSGNSPRESMAVVCGSHTDRTLRIAAADTAGTTDTAPDI